jgi:hypothetical protein
VRVSFVDVIANNVVGDNLLMVLPQSHEKKDPYSASVVSTLSATSTGKQFSVGAVGDIILGLFV